MKTSIEIIAAFLGFAIAATVIIGSCDYFGPHQSCVRAQVADKQHPMTEAEAHLECGRWIREK